MLRYMQAFIFITSYASSSPSAFLIIIYAYRTSMHLDICIVASHLGMRDARKGRGMEPNPRRCPVDHPKGRGTKQVLGSEMWTRWCKLTNLTLCRIQGKPRSILSLLLYRSNWVYICYICIVALSYRSWVKLLMHLLLSLPTLLHSYPARFRVE
jgi:hypothetical protein